MEMMEKSTLTSFNRCHLPCGFSGTVCKMDIADLPPVSLQSLGPNNADINVDVLYPLKNVLVTT